MRNGTLVDAYVDFGPNASDEGSEAAAARGHHKATAQVVAPNAQFMPVFTTAVSTDGGATWHPEGTSPATSETARRDSDAV